MAVDLALGQSTFDRPQQAYKRRAIMHNVSQVPSPQLPQAPETIHSIGDAQVACVPGHEMDDVTGAPQPPSTSPELPVLSCHGLFRSVAAGAGLATLNIAKGFPALPGVAQGHSQSPMYARQQ
mmetsp:Transcript_62847/g.202699  ORF Transcript_62847/g.202699 Transcript_62847/m.202699 type:complete len:123 (+) Transcript_62847:947-1315(+)